MKNNKMNQLLEECITRDFTLDEIQEIIKELNLLKQRKEQLKKNYNNSYLRTDEERWYKNRLINCHMIFKQYKLKYLPEELIKE